MVHNAHKLLRSKVFQRRISCYLHVIWLPSPQFGGVTTYQDGALETLCFSQYRVSNLK
jgi:hypothetical protein